jgi:hypothetical protein
MKTILLILLTLSLSGQTFKDKDWNAEKHFYASFGINLITSEVVYRVTKNPYKAALTGIAVSKALGYAKERIWDKEMGRGVYSNADLLVNAFGNIAGTFVFIIRLDVKNKNKKQDYYED